MFPSAQQGERQSGGGVGMGDQAHVEEEGQEEQADRGARVGQAEQAARAGMAGQEAIGRALWSPRPERALILRESRRLSASSSLCVYRYIHFQNLINNCCSKIKIEHLKACFIVIFSSCFTSSLSQSLFKHKSSTP